MWENPQNALNRPNQFLFWYHSHECWQLSSISRFFSFFLSHNKTPTIDTCKIYGFCCSKTLWPYILAEEIGSIRWELWKEAPFENVIYDHFVIHGMRSNTITLIKWSSCMCFCLKFNTSIPKLERNPNEFHSHTLHNQTLNHPSNAKNFFIVAINTFEWRRHIGTAIHWIL